MEHGPTSIEVLVGKVIAGEIRSTIRVKAPWMWTWVPAHDIKVFRDALVEAWPRSEEPENAL